MFDLWKFRKDRTERKRKKKEEVEEEQEKGGRKTENGRKENNIKLMKLVSKYSSFRDILDPANDLKISAHQKLQENVSVHPISNV